MSTIAPNPMPELAPLLKRLRLSGILDSLETRNREAVANKIPYTDFLALLIADEVARREHKKFNLRIRRAGFRSSKTLEQFDFDFNPAIDQSLITELASCRFVAEKVAVLIAGPCGTGKSHIAQALGHAAVRADHDVLFTTQSQLLASLHAARAINAYERRFQTFARVPLLVIDDFGLKPLRAPQDEDFHDLVAERYERGATVVTSNLDFSEWGDAFPNRLLGAATLDRLRHGAYPHLLRHTMATRLLALGMDITDIQKFLGHEDIGATRIYAETSLAMLRRKFDQVTDETGSELLGAVRTRHGAVVGAFAADLLSADGPPVSISADA